MSESWPLFQSALSSTPFSGTLADTSSQTPAGTLPQVPVANEAPGAAGDRARAEKLKSSDALDAAIQQHSDLLKHLNDMKWSKHPESDRWVRRQRLGLNGNKDTEPPEMMYQRFKAMDAVGKNLQALIQERRLLDQPKPGDEAFDKAQGQDVADSLLRIQRRQQIREVSDHLVQQGKPGIPEDVQLAFEWNPTTNISKESGVQSPEDLAKSIKASQEIGQQATPEGITHLPLSMQGPAGDALIAKQREDAVKQAREKKATAAQERYLGFPGIGPLRKEINATYDRISETLKTEVEGEGFVRDMLGNQVPGKVMRRILTPENAQKARQMALDEFPGSENVPELKNYVSGKGSAPAEQKDVSVEATRARLKALAASK